MKKILLYGLGITGIAAGKMLQEMDFKYDVLVDDFIEKTKETIKEHNLKPINLFSKTKDMVFTDYEFILKSPGIKLSHPTVKEMQKEKIPIYSDIELAYRLWKQRKIIAVTGTNGKTTTVTLTGKLLESEKRNVYVTGNIGKGLLWDFFQGKDDDIYLVETSSFQLEFVEQFAPHIAGILNITPDHLDWHGSMENYSRAKLNLIRKQTSKDIAVLNWDDPVIREGVKGLPMKKRWISLYDRVYGYYRENGYIVEDLEEKIPLVSLDKIHVPGEHNIQNILMSIALARATGVSKEKVNETLDLFRGVEHRIEWVAEIEGVRYYNDSKGTNVDASVKAIQAFSEPLVLIAGGYDKKVPLEGYFDAFEGKVKALILLGETKYQFEKIALERGVTKPYVVNTMEEAVDLAKSISLPGDVVLLSPASASWDMYSGYEERGNEFKKLIKQQ